VLSSMSATMNSTSLADLGIIYASNSSGQFDLSNYNIAPGVIVYISATVGDAASGGCFDISDFSTPVVYYNPVMLDYDFECINGEYFANIMISGGSVEAGIGDFVITGSGLTLGDPLNGSGGILGSDFFTDIIVDANGVGSTLAGPLVCGSPYTFTASCCNGLCSATETLVAPCLDEVGTMPNSSIITCSDNAPIISTSIIAGSGTGLQTYILHNGDPTNPIATNTTGQFNLADYGIAPGMLVYISAAANFGSPCVEYSTSSQQVTYYPPVSVDVTTYCDGNGQLCADVLISGGSPSVDPTLEYTVSFGSLSGNYPPNSANGLMLTNCGYSPGQTVSVSATCCNSACTATDFDTTPNVFYNGSLCQDPFIVTSDSSVVCNASGSGAGGVLNYYVASGSGGTLSPNDIVAGPQLDGNFTGLNLPACEDYQIFAVYGEDLDNNNLVDNPMDACTTLLPGPTLNYYVPVQIHPMIMCVEDQPGFYQVHYTLSGGSPECDTTCNDTYTVNGVSGFCYGESYVLPTVYELGVENYSICAEDANGMDMCIVSPVQQDCVTLPIELISYTGSLESNGNLLQWETATELNNDYYTMYKSTDGVEFTEIGTVQGAGTTISVSEYVFLDTENLSGTNYYKLTQTDFDGRTEEVGIVQLTRGKEAVAFNSTLNILALSPNPASNNLQVEFVAKQGLTEFKVYDMAGRVYSNFSMESDNGENVFDIDVNSYAKGAYLLSIRNSDEVVSQKFMKQ